MLAICLFPQYLFLLTRLLCLPKFLLGCGCDIIGGMDDDYVDGSSNKVGEIKWAAFTIKDTELAQNEDGPGYFL